jgi:tetratricopeptide (TPR) repeat protein
MRNIKTGAYILSIIVACTCTTAWTAAAPNVAPPTTNTTNPTIDTAVTPSVPSANPTTANADTSTTLSHQEILTHLLQADLAAQRNMPEVALDNYLMVAKSTNDPQVAQLATEMAIQTQSPQKALDAAEIWANAQPTDLEAQLVAATLFITSNPDKATTFLNNAFAINNPDIDQHLLLIMNQLSPLGQKNLVAAVYKIAAQRSKDPYAQLSAAQLAASEMEIDKAEKQVKLALNLKPDLTSAIELNAKIIRYRANDDKPALAYLGQQVNKFPKNSELRLFYITALLDNDQTDKALPNLNVLTKDKDLGGEAYLTLGEIYIGQDKLNTAEDNIKKALNFPLSADKAKFYLAQIAEYKKDNVQAIKYYEDISEDSEFHVQGFLRAAYLYATAGNYDDALDIIQNASPTSFDDQKQVLLAEIDILVDADQLDKALDNCNKVLAIIPEDPDFLYARSVVYSMLHKPVESEHDLRAILKIDPNNANALNALGFTLANQPNRVHEAMPFIQKALSLNPENPAFMDSMGWLLYKLGRSQEAITMLDKAYKMSGDNDIAAHLGEVLWSSGNKDAAKAIWGKALLSAQDPTSIKDTLNRLKVPMSDVQNSSAANNKSKAKEPATN